MISTEKVFGNRLFFCVCLVLGILFFISSIQGALPQDDFSQPGFSENEGVESFPSSIGEDTVTGCFTYIDSPYFCQEISLSQAEEECSVFDRCQAGKVFVPWQQCSTVQSCKKFICKASCLEEYAGRCPSGEAPKEDWCVPGCCQFDYGDAESQNQFCQFVASRQHCEIEVANKEAREYRFNAALSKNICTQQCTAQWTISVNNETISNVLLSKNESQGASGSAKPASSFISGIGVDVIAWIVILGAIIFLLYFFREKLKSFVVRVGNSSSPQDTGFLKILSPFNSNPWAQWKLRAIQKKHDNKVKKHQREQFLSEQGLMPVKPAPKKGDDAFRKLHRIARNHEPPRPSPSLPAASSASPFSFLESSPRESSQESSLKPSSPVPSEAERSRLFDRLKDLSEKRKQEK